MSSQTIGTGFRTSENKDVFHIAMLQKVTEQVSFLLSIPTMFAAALFSLYKHHVALGAHQWGVLAVGFVVSFVVAWPVVAWFLHYLKTHSFRVFVVYRVVVGLAIIVAVWRGYLK